MCVTTPLVPPPSLILRRDEPGPIGSVARFARASWPGSIAMRVHFAGAAVAAGATRRSAAALAAVNVERIEEERPLVDGPVEADRARRGRTAGVEDLVVGVGRRLPRAGRDPHVGERVG